MRRGRSATADGRLGVCHRGELTHSIAIAYSVLCNFFPSSYPSFAIRCPKALKTVCGRLEIVDRRDDCCISLCFVKNGLDFSD